MGRRRGTGSPPPEGMLASRSALASLAAWLHYEPANAAASILRPLQDHHAERLPSAEQAVAEAWDVLDATGTLADFQVWRAEHQGFGATWPTRERAERMRRVPAV